MPVEDLTILLQEDLTIRGGAQLWLLNCGARLAAVGHAVKFLLPEDSLILEDCGAVEGRSPRTTGRRSRRARRTTARSSRPAWKRPTSA